MNSLALLFSERHLNLKMIILTSFSFRSVLTSRSIFTIMLLFKCSYLDNYTRQLHEIFSNCSASFDVKDVCKIRKSHFMSLMQVNILCITTKQANYLTLLLTYQYRKVFEFYFTLHHDQLYKILKTSKIHDVKGIVMSICIHVINERSKYRFAITH